MGKQKGPGIMINPILRTIEEGVFVGRDIDQNCFRVETIIESK